MATATYILPIEPEYMQALVGDTPISYDAIDLRYLIGAVFPRVGRVGSSDSFWVYQRAAGANWSVDVQAGHAIVGDPGRFDRYLTVLDTRTNIPLTGFITNPVATRTHKVYLTVDDKNFAGSTYAGRIVVTEDTGAGAPLPTGSAYYLQLAQFTVTAAQSTVTTAQLTQSAPRASQATATGLLSLAASIVSTSVLSIGAPRARINGNTVQLSGAVSRSSAALFAAGADYLIATIFPSSTPPANRYMAGIGYLSQAYRLQVNTSGEIWAHIPPGATPLSWISLDGISYDLEGG